MADSVTAVYEFVKPEVGGSDNTWGTKLNAQLDKIEDLLTSVFVDGTPTFLGRLTDAGLPNSLNDPLTVNNIFTVSAAGPQFRMRETDQVSPAGWWRFIGEGGTLRVQAATGPELTPWDTIENALTFNKSTNKFNVHYGFVALNVAEFQNTVVFLEGVQYPTSGGGTVLLTDVALSGAGTEQFRMRFSQANSHFVISNGDGAWLSYQPDTQTFETSTYFNFAARTIVERLDVLNAGSSTVYFGTLADPDANGYVSSFGASTLQMYNGGGASGFDLAGTSMNITGAITKLLGGHFLLGNEAGVETGRLYKGTNGVILRNVDDGDITCFIEFNDNGEVNVTADRFNAPIYADTLPQPGSATEEVAERARIAGHRNQMAVAAQNNLMFALHTQSGSPAVAHGAIVTGEKLRPANAQPDNVGSARSVDETWMCLGFIGGSANASERTTMWRRIT